MPPELRQITTSGGDDANCEHVIGAVHISCLYYFAVILATRPFLVAFLTAKLRSSGSNTFHSATTSADREKISNLAHACLDSAVYMAQTAYQAMNSGYLLGNMCLLK